MNAFRATPSYNGLSYDSTSQSSFFGASSPSTYYPSIPQPTISQPQQEQEQFEKDRYKAREQVLQKYRHSAQQPQRACWYVSLSFSFLRFSSLSDGNFSYCGEESVLECNLCAKTGYATYFCSIEHQTLMWKEHMRVHQAYLAANK